MAYNGFDGAKTTARETGRPHLPSHGLHAGHFAFMRAVVQGMDKRISWGRYMHVGNAATVDQDIKRTINAIRSAYAAAANHYGRPGASPLLKSTPRTSTTCLPATPCLADFISAQNLDGFSEAEQIAAFQNECSEYRQMQGRRERLLTRQLASLHWLQTHLQQSPAPGDLLMQWLAPNLARRLAAADLVYVSDLLLRIDQYGSRWAVGISAIGAGKIRWITDWAWAHKTAWPGLVLDNVGVPLRTGIVPLNKLPYELLPKNTSGQLNGRQENCLIAAQTDIDAVLTWLGTKRHRSAAVQAIAIPVPVPVPGWEILTRLSNTQRSYWKEVERFLLWVILERKVTLAAVDVADCYAYKNFLLDVPARWCGPRGHDKDHPAWRPFETSMSPAASTASVAIVNGMYRFLVQQAYLKRSPWNDIDRQIAANQMPITRTLSPLDDKAWQVIDRQLARLAATSANARLRVAIALLRCCQLSLKQLVAATIGDLRLQSDVKTGTLHTTLVISPAVMVVLAPQSVAVLHGYLRTRGLDAELFPQTSQGAFLLGRATDAVERAPWAPCARSTFDPCAGIGIGTMRDQLRVFFRNCMTAATTDAATALQLSRCTSRMLRANKQHLAEET